MKQRAIERLHLNPAASVKQRPRPDGVYALRTWLARLADDPAAAALLPPAVPARVQ